MPRILLVTNDFPPTVGGIQSYLRDFLDTLDPADVLVFASTQDSQAARDFDATLPYQVIRWAQSMMLPTPATSREMSRIIADYGIETVWFGAAAPLALMAKAARSAGAAKVIASTHGHEVGWSMIPGARQILRRIGDHCDVVTYISDYTLGRFNTAFGSHPQFVHLPSGVDIQTFQPVGSQLQAQTRDRLGVGADPLVVCISRLVARKGQDQLIRALPQLRLSHPRTRLLIVGTGGYESRLRRLAAKEGVDNAVVFTGSLPFDEMKAILGCADVFAMPARTRGKGLDVEGLGIVYLEAQACAIPVIAGNSGGAPETVTADSGIVVDGGDLKELTMALEELLADQTRRKEMGEAGRVNVEDNWTWEIMGARLREIVVPM
ncbi:glycosyltransferase family 4 protein [Corynebacterium alimapuense]|uniref:phosphatidyl-myo-inositol dimannoside synthase n=1 Tax=Corynebacterium alimapuense TaxID=1576874 RepID=A0A3M8K8E3_9CORY|nr:glycosyltransferase family 4 protein [Corynebacterium alimapuense]RNE49507.1 alpha-(1-2)-phosphatidylinositol mannosyltransferase [Corynebacterium alimapuense]